MAGATELLSFASDVVSEYSTINGNAALSNVFRAFSNTSTAYAAAFSANPVQTAAETVAGLATLAALGPSAGAAALIEAGTEALIARGVGSAIAKAIMSTSVGLALDQSGKFAYDSLLTSMNGIINLLGGTQSSTSEPPNSTDTTIPLSSISSNIVIDGVDSAGNIDHTVVNLPAPSQDSNTLNIVTSAPSSSVATTETVTKDSSGNVTFDDASGNPFASYSSSQLSGSSIKINGSEIDVIDSSNRLQNSTQEIAVGTGTDGVLDKTYGLGFTPLTIPESWGLEHLTKRLNR